AALPQAKVVPLSALHGFHVPELRDWLVRQLPEHPPYFPKDQLSDRHLRFFVAEIIRDKILEHFSDEIPYSSEVVVTSFQEEPEIVRIEADIVVMREGQKAILIGHEGRALRRLGTAARKAIEDFLGMKVFLRFHIKVDEGWREDADKLGQYGY
ncbi:MAG: KH domain-containing protein, partial [Anaerolineae bacterium]|nr:KH domain-containing protein [Anaerolineae bacterium]